MRWKVTGRGAPRTLEAQAPDAVAGPPTVSAPPRPARLPAARGRRSSPELGPRSKASWTKGRWLWVLLGGILAVAAGVRIWQIAALGYNSDEAVYSGQAATIAHVNGSDAFFPAFRAHPLLIQTLLSIGYRLGGGEVFGRVAMALVGVATVFAVYRLGDLLYGRRAGLAAALLLALMPYHVVVTRQVLLDGPMTFFATVTLYLLALFATTRRVSWLYAASAAMGLTFLSKETAIVMLGSIYAFLALTPQIRVQPRHLAASFGVFVLLAATLPISLAIAGQTHTGGDFLAWQISRRPNHDLLFYPAVVTPAIGLLVVFAAVAGCLCLRRGATWRETLLLSWIAVPLLFFELWAVKGYQYLLPAAPAVALLAARALTSDQLWRAAASRVHQLGLPARFGRALADRRTQTAALAVVAISLLIPTLQRIQPAESQTVLAGSGGIPGGREAGQWIERNTPQGARMMTIGPSMANILEYYGRRRANGLAVSPNPLNRNPVYEPLSNPDRLIRDNQLQYAVWDAFSAERSSFFAAKLLGYVDRFHGRVIHTETVAATTPSGRQTRKPIITIYSVRP